MAEDLGRSVGRLEGQVGFLREDMTGVHAKLDNISTQLGRQKARHAKLATYVSLIVTALLFVGQKALTFIFPSVK